MARVKEYYTIIRYWENAWHNGMDILGITTDYSEAAKIIDEMIEERPYCDWEVEGLSTYDRDVQIEELSPFERGDDKVVVVKEMSGSDADLEGICRYRITSLGSAWNYAYFYIAATEKI